MNKIMASSILNWKFILIWTIFASFQLSQATASEFTLDIDSESVVITSETEILNSSNPKLNLTSVKNFFDQRFTSIQRDLLLTEITEGSVWIRLRINNEESTPVSRILIFQTYHALDVSYYIPETNEEIKTGHGIKFSERPITATSLALPITFSPGFSEHLIQLHGKRLAPIKLYLQTSAYFYQKQFQYEILFGTLLSFFAIITLVSLFLAVRNQNLSYLLIFGLTLFSMLNVFGSHGFLSPLINRPYIDISGIHFTMLMAASILVSLTTKLTYTLSEKSAQIAYNISLVIGFIAIYSLLPNTIYFTPIFYLLNYLALSVCAAMLLISRGYYGVGTRISGLIIFLSVILGIITELGMIDTLVYNAISQPILSFLVCTLIFTDYFMRGNHLLAQGSSDKNALPDQYLHSFIQQTEQDIRIPLDGAIEFIEQLEKTNLSAKQHNIVNSLRSAGLETKFKLNEVNLMLSALADAPLQAQPINLAELIHHQLTLRVQDATAKENELICNIDHKVPKLFNLNSKSLNFVISVLLKNAIKHTEKGDIYIQTTVDENQNIRIRVTDSGCGISPKLRNNLFQFNKKFTSGNGHTLPLCALLIRKMGGAIGVSSEVKKGTTFWISFPGQKKALDNTLITDIKKTLRSVKVLVVEDNLRSRQTIYDYATSIGIQIDCCSNAFEAINLLQTKNHLDQAYDVIFVDQYMPEMNGLQFANRLMRDPKLKNYLKIILLTENRVLDNMATYYENGIDHVLQKPLIPDHFYNMIIKSLPEYRTKIK